MIQLNEVANAKQYGYWKLCRIGPTEAQQLLDTMARNRKPTWTRINMYRDSIKVGEWLVTHQGIAIHNGQMIDGQNRCHAIVQSGKAVDVWVYFSQGVDYMREIDRQQARRDAQLAHICGVDTTQQDVSVAIVLDLGRAWVAQRGQTQTHKLLERLERLEPVLVWLRNNGFARKRRGLSQSMIVGAIGRGVIVHGTATMLRFIDIYLNLPAFEKHESAAARLRDVALQIGKSLRSDRMEVYLKAAAAINAFAERRSLAKLYATDMPDEPLPIDWDAVQDKIAALK